MVIAELDRTNRGEKTRKIKKKFHDFLTPSGAAPPHPHILAQGKHIKNRLDGPKTTPPRTKHAKFQASIMFRLGCRGGWVKKWGVTFSIRKILVVITPEMMSFVPEVRQKLETNTELKW